MGKSIATYDCFIRLDRHIHQTGYHTAGRINLLCIDIGLNIDLMMTLDNHCDFFESGISSTFADTVNGHLYLTGSIQNTSNRICCCHSQIVMTVSRKNRVINAVYMINQIFNLCTIFGRQTVTRRIRYIHHCRSRFDNRFYHTCQIFIVRTSCILCIKFHIIHKTTCILHCCYRAFDNLFPIGVEFIFNMRVRSTYTCMDTFMLGEFQSVYRYINILLNSTGQSTNSGPSHRFRNFNHRIKISRAGDGEAGFNYIDPQSFECLRYLNLLHCVQLASRNLFTIPKGGIKNK